MKIAIDIDEVLAEQLNALVDFYKTKTGVFISKEKFHTDYWPEVWGISLEEAIKVDGEFKNSKLFNNLATVKGSVNAIKSLSEKHRLIIITSRPIKTKAKTCGWLDSNFGDSFEDIFFSCEFHIDNESGKSKLEICEGLGIGLLVEDSREYSWACAEKGIRVLLLDKPWNQNCEHKNIFRCKDWDEVVDKIKEIENEK